MNIKEMRELPEEELLTEIEKNREKVFQMRFQGKGKDLENPGQLKLLRKDIARMNTVLSERRVAWRKKREADARGAGGDAHGAGGPAKAAAVRSQAPHGGGES